MSSKGPSDPPLKGIRVLELAGLAPAPFAGMILSDFGADVIRIDRQQPAWIEDTLARGKRSLAIDMKHPLGQKTFLELAEKADIVIEPFRPGVMERMGFGPDVLLEKNPGLIYARLTGFGQTGRYAAMAGHDMNYVAASGVLSILGRKESVPTPPANILADFAGGGMTCALGIMMALFDRTRTGQGQVIDSAMCDGVNYLSTFMAKFIYQDSPVWNKPRGENLLDSGAPFHDTYQCKDGKFVTVAPLEPQFYALFLKGLGLDSADLPKQNDRKGWPKLREVFTATILTKTRDEWAAIFEGTDACVLPILEMDEILPTTDKKTHAHDRGLLQLVKGADPTKKGNYEPRAAPVLSRTPAVDVRSSPKLGEHGKEVLSEWLGTSEETWNEMVEAGIIGLKQK